MIWLKSKFMVWFKSKFMVWFKSKFMVWFKSKFMVWFKSKFMIWFKSKFKIWFKSKFVNLWYGGHEVKSSQYLEKPSFPFANISYLSKTGKYFTFLY